MLPLLLLAAAAPQMTAVDAERAFAAAAQSDGQWTAFKRYADPQAVMFIPESINAQIFLAKLKDPPKAIDWWPTASYVSCDGKLAVNTGGWKRPDGAVGYFSTVWVKQQDGGWKWLVDGGDELKEARAQAEPVTKQASCKGIEPLISFGEPTGQGSSPDHSLFWKWAVGGDGSRRFQAFLWDGSNFRPVIDDHIAAQPK